MANKKVKSLVQVKELMNKIGPMPSVLATSSLKNAVWRRKDIHLPANYLPDLIKHSGNKGYLFALASQGLVPVSLSMIENANKELDLIPAAKEFSKEMDRFYACCLHDSTIENPDQDETDYGWENNDENL